MIHLDTSFLIRALLRDSAEQFELRQWLSDGVAVGISAIGWAEFLCGPLTTKDIELAAQIVLEPTPFAGDDAALAAELFNRSGRRRGTMTDCMIAATAVRSAASLATANPSDFRKLEPAGLRVVHC